MSKKHIVIEYPEGNTNKIFFENGDCYSIEKKEDGTTAYYFIMSYKKIRTGSYKSHPSQYYEVHNLYEKKVGYGQIINNSKKIISECNKELKQNPGNTDVINRKKAAEDSLRVWNAGLAQLNDSIAFKEKIVDSIKTEYKRKFTEKAFTDINLLIQNSEGSRFENAQPEIRYFDGAKWFYFSIDNFNEKKKYIFLNYKQFLEGA